MNVALRVLNGPDKDWTLQVVGLRSCSDFSRKSANPKEVWPLLRALRRLCQIKRYQLADEGVRAPKVLEIRIVHVEFANQT